MQRRTISENITQYIIGTPFDTNAVVIHSDSPADSCDRIPHFNAEYDDNGGLQLTKSLSEDEKRILKLYRSGKYKEIVNLMMEKI